MRNRDDRVYPKREEYSKPITLKQRRYEELKAKRDEALRSPRFETSKKLWTLVERDRIDACQMMLHYVCSVDEENTAKSFICVAGGVVG